MALSTLRNNLIPQGGQLNSADTVTYIVSSDLLDILILSRVISRSRSLPLSVLHGDHSIVWRSAPHSNKKLILNPCLLYAAVQLSPLHAHRQGGARDRHPDRGISLPSS